MITFLKKNLLLLITFLVTLFIYYPSLFVFFTNDDFYFLKIVNDISLYDFANSFNIFTKNIDGFGAYRPLTTQLFYLIKEPFVMHTIVFITFFAVLASIYKLGKLLFKNEAIPLIATYLYAVSATHFAHFYYLSTYQELGMTLFLLLTILTHITKKYNLSILFFILALMCKETAVVTPFLVILIDWYRKININKKVLAVYLLLLTIYLLSHFFIYGTATGDSYIWSFEIRKLLNTIVWYLLWSFNLPETLVDFIGPGLKVNPNLFTYWSSVIYPIFGLFIIQITLVIYLILAKIKEQKNGRNFLFAAIWFVTSLLPVIFLPIHKFSFYLTLPLIGLVYRIAYLIDINKVRSVFVATFLIIWTSLSILTVRHSVNTSWITNGEKISKNVYNYFKLNDFGETDVHFVDTRSDENLPWSPTGVIKNSLSDKNFFYVFYPELTDRIFYSNGVGTQVSSRQFLGY